MIHICIVCGQKFACAEVSSACLTMETCECDECLPAINCRTCPVNLKPKHKRHGKMIGKFEVNNT